MPDQINDQSSSRQGKKFEFISRIGTKSGIIMMCWEHSCSKWRIHFLQAFITTIIQQMNGQSSGLQWQKVWNGFPESDNKTYCSLDQNWAWGKGNFFFLPRGRYMSQKSITFPCIGVKFSKPFPKQTVKLIDFFTIRIGLSTINQFYFIFLQHAGVGFFIDWNSFQIVDKESNENLNFIPFSSFDLPKLFPKYLKIENFSLHRCRK